ncbi:MAG TPA: phosphate acyltransferase PlsX [Candidatus Methylomirabilis sp.]|nr:phosphate acyltransferase PlsX [Candidatus Methylomirabilis sp.]
MDIAPTWLQDRPPVCIALDAMGGDGGPAVNVEGAIAAARELGLGVILVGVQEEVRRHLDRHELSGLPIRIRHASEVVEMEESPSTALRKKKDSSIRVAVDLVRNGDADAVVSAGNTGAVMAIALVVLGPLPGVERPAIAALLPTLAGHAILLDVGANVDCKPRHLVQFAIMGNVYARQALGKARPRVGLLSIGEEETKGNELTKEAFRALEEEPSIEFIGNVEGVDVFKGHADVVVCDGFTGNVALKIGESVAETIMALIRDEVAADLRSRAGALLLKPAFRRLRQRLDYSEVGGAPLLGVNGITIISHGRSSGKAIRNALRVAGECVKSHVLDNIRDGIAQS